MICGSSTGLIGKGINALYNRSRSNKLDKNYLGVRPALEDEKSYPILESQGGPFTRQGSGKIKKNRSNRP